MAPSLSNVALAAGACATVLATHEAFVTVPGAQVKAVVPEVQVQLRGTSGSSPCSSTMTVGATLCGAGAALVLASTRRRETSKATSSLRAFEKELGVQAPLGYFDPLGMSKDGDVETFRRRRESEIKNGRVAMFAVIGYIVPEYYKFPGYLAPSAQLKFADVPNGIAAVGKVPVEGWLQWIALCGLYETVVNISVDPAQPGNYGKGQLGMGNMVLGFTGPKIQDAEKRNKSLNSEIANGRLAMMAITGMLVQNGIFGTTGPQMWLPAQAAQDLLKGTGGPFADMYWDPAGLSKGKTDAEILNYRAMELKHGRVAMLAVLGWFHNAAGLHFIADFAIGEPVSNNPLVAVTQLPLAGMFQVVFTIMCFEWLTLYICKPPAEKPWDVFGWTDIIADEEYPEWKKAQLQELNNGRLAMIAFLGLITQDVLFGDYGAGAREMCGGASICADYQNWEFPWPPSPGGNVGLIPFQVTFNPMNFPSNV